MRMRLRLLVFALVAGVTAAVAILAVAAAPAAILAGTSWDN
jgi:hypothetical protein